MRATTSVMLAPLIQRHIFHTEEDAIKELLRTYILGQLAELQQRIEMFKKKYGMEFGMFGEYLHERSELLQTETLSPDQRQKLGRTIMQEEDDWFDWKVALEMIDAWLGLRQEVNA